MSVPVLRGFEASQADIEFVQDADFDVKLTDTLPDGSDPRDWTNHSAELVIHDDAGVVLHTMSTDNGLIKLGDDIPLDGGIQLITPLATVNGFTWECATYRLSITDPEGMKKPYMYGLAIKTDRLPRDCPSA